MKKINIDNLMGLLLAVCTLSTVAATLFECSGADHIVAAIFQWLLILLASVIVVAALGWGYHFAKNLFK